MHNKVIPIDFQGQFRTCPTCGYRDGFHSMFKRESGVVKWLFICPACHDTFDLGMTAAEPTATGGDE